MHPMGHLTMVKKLAHCLSCLSISLLPLSHSSTLSSFDYFFTFLLSLFHHSFFVTPSIVAGNKYGEPVVCGFARSFGQRLPNKERVEWIKPIMFTAGLGWLDSRHTVKGEECCLENVLYLPDLVPCSASFLSNSDRKSVV